MKKEMIEPNKINDIIKRIVNNFNPEKIILFGSFASGKENNDSDIDLLIIQDTNLPRHLRSFEIRKSLIGMMVPIDILVYNPEEFEKEKKEKFSFLNYALKTSKVLYESNR